MGATTIHGLFEFDADYQTKMDFAKLENKKVINLIQMQVLMFDEGDFFFNLPILVTYLTQ